MLGAVHATVNCASPGVTVRSVGGAWTAGAGQELPMLSWTRSPADQLRPALVQSIVPLAEFGMAKACEPTQKLSACSAVFTEAAPVGPSSFTCKAPALASPAAATLMCDMP